MATNANAVEGKSLALNKNHLVQNNLLRMTSNISISSFEIVLKQHVTDELSYSSEIPLLNFHA